MCARDQKPRVHNNYAVRYSTVMESSRTSNRRIARTSREPVLDRLLALPFRGIDAYKHYILLSSVRDQAHVQFLASLCNVIEIRLILSSLFLHSSFLFCCDSAIEQRFQDALDMQYLARSCNCCRARSSSSCCFTRRSSFSRSSRISRAILEQKVS